MDILDQETVVEVDPDERNDNAASRDSERCSEVELLVPQTFGIEVDELFERTSPASPTSYYSARSDGEYSPLSDELVECESVLSDSDIDIDFKEAEILPREEEEEEGEEEAVAVVEEREEEEKGEELEEEDSDYDPERLQIQREHEAMEEDMARAPKLPSPVVIPEDLWSISDGRHIVHDPMGLFRKDERLGYLEHRHRELSSDMRTRVHSLEKLDKHHVVQTSRTGKEVEDREGDSNNSETGEGKEEIDDDEQSKCVDLKQTTTAMAPTINSKVQQRELEAIKMDKATIKKRQSLMFILKGWVSKLSHLCPHKRKRRRKIEMKRKRYDMPHDMQQQSSAASAT